MHQSENVRAAILLVREFAAQHDGVPAAESFDDLRAASRADAARDCLRDLQEALHEATKTLAGELIERGITVNTVNPGPTDTGWEISGRDPRPAMPLGRWGEPDDAARVVAWLCSDDARWITGQVIDSEGGFRR